MHICITSITDSQISLYDHPFTRSLSVKLYPVSLWPTAVEVQVTFWLDDPPPPHVQRVHYKVKCAPYMYNVLPVPPCSGFNLFRSTASHFRLTGHFEIMHQLQVTQKWHWTLQGQKVLNIVLTGISSCRPLWKKCTEWPQMTLKVSILNIHVCLTRVQNFNPFRSPGNYFLSYRPFDISGLRALDGWMDESGL